MDHVFKKGDKVRWTVGGRGGSRLKTGTIRKSVLAGTIPNGFKKARPYKSYLVVDEDNNLFWPAVKSLEMA